VPISASAMRVRLETRSRLSLRKAPRALARVEQVVARRVVDDGLLHLAAKRQADRDCVRRQAVDEVGGAVERIDDPDIVAVLGAARRARFLGEDAVPGIGAEQHVDDRGLGGVVDLGDEIVRRLSVDLQPVEVERGPVDDRPRRRAPP
jgi:hypothetical protein